MDENQQMMTYFLEMYDGIEVFAPSSRDITVKALNIVKNEKKRVEKIIDIGSGVGAQSFVLSEETGAHVVALDNHAPFLKQINDKVDQSGGRYHIDTITASMNDIPCNLDQFDLLWCEGAVYNIGFEKGLNEWKSLLKPDGIMAVSEVVWLKPDRPKEISTFWDSEYPGMKDDAFNVSVIERCGYRLLDRFVLPKSAWKSYYQPLLIKTKEMKIKYAKTPLALQVVEMTEKEIEMFDKYSAYYGYVFYIFSK